MLIRRSTYVHLTPLGDDRVLVVHAISHLRLVLDSQVAGIIAWFDTPRDVPADMPILRALLPGIDPDTLAGCLATLMDHGVLTDRDLAGEHEAVATRLADLHGRDPGEALDRLRRQDKQGADPYWSVTRALKLPNTPFINPCPGTALDQPRLALYRPLSAVAMPYFWL